MTIIHACLIASIPITTGHALPGAYHLPLSPPLPAYATQEWIHYAASIVAGETVPDCEICHLWIACTIKQDAESNRLHPGRWHGYRTPSPPHLAAVETALQEQGCLNVPACAYLGNLNDYRYWSAGRLAEGVPSHVVGTRHGSIVCIPPPGPTTPPVETSTAATANTTPRRPASPTPA